MSLYPDTHAMRADAQRLSGQAAHVRAQAAAVRTAATQVRWRGPAAAMFQGRVGSLYAAFIRTAGELEDAAAALRAHADAVDAEINRLLNSPLADAEFALTAGPRLLESAGGFVVDTASSALKTVEGLF